MFATNGSKVNEALKHFLEKHADPVKLWHPAQPFPFCVSAMAMALCAETPASSLRLFVVASSLSLFVVGVTVL